MTVRITDRDRGYRRVVAEVGQTARQKLTVGIHEEKGGELHDGEMTVAAIAMIHEFGAEAVGVPERSWLRGGIDAGKSRIEMLMRRLGKLILKGRLSSEQAHAMLGEDIVSIIRERIREGIAPPNEQATIDRKGSSTPLIDSGQMIQSIGHEVR